MHNFFVQMHNFFVQMHNFFMQMHNFFVQMHNFLIAQNIREDFDSIDTDQAPNKRKPPRNNALILPSWSKFKEFNFLCWSNLIERPISSNPSQNTVAHSRSQSILQNSFVFIIKNSHFKILIMFRCCLNRNTAVFLHTLTHSLQETPSGKIQSGEFQLLDFSTRECNGFH